MRKEQFELYELSEDRENKLWKTCIFIFDTSALLNFYYYSSKAQKGIFTEIFEKIQDRLWIPQHVEYEYLKNREKAIKKLIDEKYKEIKNNQLKNININIDNIKKRLKELQDRIKNNNTHPYFDIEIIKKFEKESSSKFEEDFKIFEQKINDEIKKRKDEIDSIVKKDPLLEAFDKYLTVGDEYSYEKILKIIKEEGELRYKFNIPPGYMDLKGKDKKEGIQAFGDLIIWKQMIDYAQKNKKSIVFIVDDVKIDWCYGIKRSSETRIEKPREELIKEMRDTAGVEFWMYTQSQFVYTAKKLLKSKLGEDIIEEIKLISEHMHQKIEISGILKIKCDKCNAIFSIPAENLYLDFYEANIEERPMGLEYLYNGHGYAQCSKCNEDILIICKVWEYPLGAKNHEEIEIDGARIINPFIINVNLD